MLELEVKVMNNNLKDLEEKIIGLGGRLIAKENQINTILDTEDKKIQKDLSGYLRIRETKSYLDGEENITLTFKKDLKGDKIRKNIEINSSIKEKDNIIKIFSELGYGIVNIGYKNRISYLLDGIRFDLDTWDKDTYPYPYMEIEVEKEEDLFKAIKLLSIRKEDITTKSITELQKDLESETLG